ncbi:hypothetical protein MKX01_012550 [Papaver californicum]|nr:hypothetical protein MKX01_012550 [Papaver californicum]
MDMDLSENQPMILRTLSAEQIAINEKKMNMTLDDIIKVSRKTACCDPRNPRASSNKRKNVSMVGGNFSTVWSLRESKPSMKQNRTQKFPTAGAPLEQGLATQRYLNLQAIATNVQPATTRTRPLIRNKMPNLSNSRVPAFVALFTKEKLLVTFTIVLQTAYEKVNLEIIESTSAMYLKWFSNSTSKAGITPVQKRRFAEKKQKEMKWQKQGYGAQEFGSFCAYVNARKKVVPHSTEYYEYWSVGGGAMNKNSSSTA